MPGAIMTGRNWPVVTLRPKLEKLRLAALRGDLDGSCDTTIATTKINPPKRVCVGAESVNALFPQADFEFRGSLTPRIRRIPATYLYGCRSALRSWNRQDRAFAAPLKRTTIDVV